jgi:hypothetical protein
MGMIRMNSRHPTRQAPREPPRPVLRFGPSAVVLLVALAALASTGTAACDSHAHAARALNVNDTAHLHYVKESHGQLIDEGAATGSLPGTVRIAFDVGATVVANFTINTHSGSIIGNGSGTLHTSKSRSDVYVSFAGTLTVSRGTSLYAHAHGHGGFYGTVDRKNYSATIQTTGTLSY